MKSNIFCAALAALYASGAAAQGQHPADPAAKAPAVQYRSAFEGYRAFVEPEVGDWRRANEEVGKAGGHAGHRPGQGPGKPGAKPQPGKPETQGGPAEKGYEAHK